MAGFSIRAPYLENNDFSTKYLKQNYKLVCINNRGSSRIVTFLRNIFVSFVIFVDTLFRYIKIP
jgi:hypothetical protein